MNQEDNKKQVLVKLLKDNDVDILEFDLGAGKNHKISVNSEDSQSKIKAMFCDLLLLLENDAIELKLEPEDGYDNKLLEEVSTAYIDDLNKEITSVRAEMLDKYPAENEGNE